MTDHLVNLLARRFSWPPGSGVLLAGSTAEGVAMRGSNVNVLVIDAPADWTPPADGPRQPVLRPMSLARNYLYEDDPVITLDVLRPERMADLAGLAEGMSRIRDPLTPDLELPVLDILEIRLLARLRSGRIVHGDRVVAGWRERMRLRWLPAFHCATTYLTAEHFHRKAMTAHADGLPLDASVLLRLAVEHLLISALAADGRVLHEVKNLGRNVAAARSAGARSPRLLREAEDLLGRTAKAEPETFALIEECSADLLHRLPSTAHGRPAAAYLDGRVHAAQGE
ncbi:hypothetical protein ACIRD2_09265 [Streptomyces sp. NPDC093595]|uniref:hypothetical protein n=1 Tax=Streptomyces sp. NPDC093595 TaxID=3366045 RepID=UPI00380A3CBE